MHGAIHSYFLETFLFWHCRETSTLYAEPRHDKTHIRYALRIHVLPYETDSPTMISHAIGDTHAAVIEKTCIRGQSGNTSLSPQYLVNVNTANNASLARLREVLTRIEDASHMLVWCEQQSHADRAIADSMEVDVVKIELVRLNLCFVPKLDHHGILQLYSVDHAGYYVSDTVDDALSELLKKFPFSILLQNSRQEYGVLMCNAPLYRPRILSMPFSNHLVTDRNHQLWSTTMNTKFYIYHVHVSHTFLLPSSLASTFYLILLYLLQRCYHMAFQLCDTCEVDHALSGEELFVLQQFERTLHDKHPNAHAVRIKLFTVLSQTNHNIQWQADESKV